MSTTIDNKVVSMEFNNKNFEKNKLVLQWGFAS